MRGIPAKLLWRFLIGDYCASVLEQFLRSLTAYLPFSVVITELDRHLLEEPTHKAAALVNEPLVCVSAKGAEGKTSVKQPVYGAI
jgi:hypothetical protein